MANERDREIWDDATNAVCQAMQEQKMCNCPDGDCLAAKIDFSPEKIATATRPAPAEDEVTIPRNPTEAMMDAGLYHCSHDMEWSDLFTAWQAMFDTVTLDGGMTEHAKASPAPAATDTGLETVAWRFRDLWEGGHKYWKFTERRYDLEETEFRALCDRSQAEELLAAKDKTIALAETTMIEMHQDLNKLEADNAAKDARINSLERIWKKAESRAEALEAKLAAAEKALEFYADVSKYPAPFTGGFGELYYDCGEKARAVLGGKPS